MFAMLGFKENRKFLKKLKKKKKINNKKNNHADLFHFQTIVIPGIKADSWWCTVLRIK